MSGMGMNLHYFSDDSCHDTSGSVGGNSDSTQGGHYGEATSSNITQGDPDGGPADESTYVAAAEPTQNFISQDLNQPAANTPGDSEPFIGDELNESFSPLPELTEAPIEQDFDGPDDNQDEEDGQDWPTGPPTEPPALWYIGDDPTSRTLEYILEHRRAHALDRADLALETARQFHRAADKMVRDAEDQDLEISEIEVYNVRMEARRYVRMGRRLWKILDKQNAEKIAAAAASSGDAEVPAPIQFMSGKRKRTGGFEARKAKRGCHTKSEDPTAGWAKRP